MTLVNKGVLEPLDSYIADSGVDLAQYKGDVYKRQMMSQL